MASADYSVARDGAKRRNYLYYLKDILVDRNGIKFLFNVISVDEN